MPVKFSLISENPAIPHQELCQGQTLVIGRNRECKIKHLKCSRRYLTVQLKNDKLTVRFCKNNKIQYFKSNQRICGPGFAYKVKMFDTVPIPNKCDLKSTSTSDDTTVYWSEHDSKRMLIGKFRDGGSASSRIAAFDFDFTLICTKSGKVFPVNANDWKLVNNRLPKLLRNLNQNGFRVVIISNQLGVSKGKLNVDEMKQRFSDFARTLDVPCLILISTNDDIYRKPRIGMWSYLLKVEQPTIDVDYTQSFYVGDAAGRKRSTLYKGDHSSGDLYFALNTGLNFMVPEQFVKCASSSNFTVSCMAKSLLNSDCFKPCSDNSYLLYNTNKNEKVIDLRDALLPTKKHCIIFCGIAASGKSSFYRQHLLPLEYVHVNLDTLKSKSKCESVARKAFEASKNCVIDNTNVDKASRSAWIALCNTYNVIPIIFYFKLPLAHIFHNCLFRKLTAGSQAAASTVSNVIIYSQNKKLEEPTPTEATGGLFHVNFLPMFSDDSHRQLYYMYLNEK